ncbi:amino acid ABC transporter permease [Prauserella sp. PE36]|uniref:Branched-chain amino acid ABC transporter permease n=1 Tax=Prauserella endophytica TaxID=1592324 RepID=A0ABY2S8T6_9PSEU|nr:MULTISPECIES: branched-chain amino acid ABC transporter permease [Prauserella]PXY29379.1 amino acid ABC transporter permease [Prauserella coralliicola]RBM20933.1 amino acid ABC transporter permease [Prauserella sp. PE36]TKG72289.1 branched-chain amino acid ABC transporter permease [Prauserella endophytica]
MAQNLLNALTLGSLYLLFALGMSLAWGTIGILNFAHGSIFMFAAFTGHLLVQQVALPLPVVLLIGTAVGAALSVLAQVLAFEPIQRRARDHRRAELQILVGGIGIATIPLAIAQHATKSVPFGFTGSTFQVEVYRLGPVQLTNVQLVILGAAAVLTGVLAWWLRSARTGLALRSIGVDAEVATMMGVNRRGLAMATMAVAGALAGIAGVLLTYYLGSIAAESGDSFLIKAFAAIVLGGIGSIGGAVAGAMILALAETVVLTQTSGMWVDAVSFGLIFAVLVLRPRGLFGRKEVRRT